MNVRIGVVNTTKELVLELSPDTNVESLRSDIEAAIVEESVFWLTDVRGRIVGIPTARLAYIDFDPGDGAKTFGFS